MTTPSPALPDSWLDLPPITRRLHARTAEAQGLTPEALYSHLFTEGNPTCPA